VEHGSATPGQKHEFPVSPFQATTDRPPPQTQDPDRRAQDGTQSAGWARREPGEVAGETHRHVFAPSEQKHEFLVGRFRQPPPGPTRTGPRQESPGWGPECRPARKGARGGCRVNTRNTVRTTGAETRVPDRPSQATTHHHPGLVLRQESPGWGPRGEAGTGRWPSGSR